METAVQIFTIEESALVFAYGWIVPVIITLIVSGFLLFVVSLAHEDVDLSLGGILVLFLGVFGLLLTLGAHHTDKRADLESRQVTAIESQLGYDLVRLDDGRYTAIDQNGQQTFGCYAAIGGPQYVLVPGGPNEDGDCLIEIAPVATPNPKE